MTHINEKQITKVAQLLKKLPKGEIGLNFYSFGEGDKKIVATDMYPELNHPQAINFFFFVCMHDYGFWYGDSFGYTEPLFGTINGKRCKGSDLLWKVAKKALDEDPLIFMPSILAKMKFDELMNDILCDDNGPILFPDMETRFLLTHAFGHWFMRQDITSEKIVASANKTKDSLWNFASSVHDIPGYNRDKHWKKQFLLAMVLANRPERFLKVKDPHHWFPLIDYHVMRLALRLGLVELDECLDEKEENINRQWVDAKTEDKIRRTTMFMIKDLIKRSGRSLSFVDEKMWMARKYCPEMKTPDCAQCIFTTVCQKRIELFQPILRTTAY